MLQHVLVDAEAACRLVDGKVLLRLLRLPSAAGLVGQSLAGLPCSEANSLLAAMDAAHAAAVLLVATAQLAPESRWAGVVGFPGLLPAAAEAFSLAASIAALPEQALSSPPRRQAAVPPLADALVVLAQTDSCSAELRAASSCHPLPLAAAVASVMGQEWCGVDGKKRLCRLLAVVLQHEESAAAFLEVSASDEHSLVPPCSTGDGAAVGSLLCTQLIEQFLAGAAAANWLSQQELHAALGGLLCHSHAAKQVAVRVGLHKSLVDSCASLAASLVAPDQPAAAAAELAHDGARRASKLQQLKARRGTGGGGGGRPQAAQLAFGSRITSSMLGRRDPPPPAQDVQQGTDSALSPPTEVQAAPHDGTPAQQPAERARLVLCLDLLHQLTARSQVASDSMAAAGLLDVAMRLWGGGGAAVQHSLSRLAAVVLAHSQAARQVAASTGKSLGEVSRMLASPSLSCQGPLLWCGTITYGWPSLMGLCAACRRAPTAGAPRLDCP